MKISLISIGFFLLPTLASAHEHQTFRMGTSTYEFTVGSLNEPVTVDDKSGVELSVIRLADDHAEEEAHDDAAPHEEAGTPVEGLQSTLQVEISAGDTKKVLPLTTIYGKAGSYKAVFFPTIATTLTYRFFGTIDDAPVDLSFTCNPAGHPQTEPSTEEVKISETVTRLKKTGAFGCPTAKEDLGFPEPSASLFDLREGAGGQGGDDSDSLLSIVALLAGLAGLGLGVAAWKRK